MPEKAVPLNTGTNTGGANKVVVGAQWGDEGKAKITDLLAEEADVVIRCQGGCNAGHTVKRGEEVFKFHLIPSGILYPGKTCIIGPGTVIDPEVLLQEIKAIEARGYSTKSLKLSERAHLTFPYHNLLDKARENALKQDKIGTTAKGIGPTYQDKVGRSGLRIGDLYEPEEDLKNRLTHILALKASELQALDAPGPHQSVDELYAFCRKYGEALKPYVDDTIQLIEEARVQKKRILLEGAQGTLLDVDYGTYPFVTGSNATAGGLCSGSGMGPTRIDEVIGVMKAYITRVGEGPFPTELSDEIGRQLGDVGQEFGTTTGRPRRCGWFDAVIGRYSALVNGLDTLAITKLDVLDGLDEIKICVAYKHRETGERMASFPSRLSDLKAAEPVFETFSGWKQDISAVRKYEDLPVEAQAYLQRLQDLVGVKIGIVSVGPARAQTIMVDEHSFPETELVVHEPEKTATS